MKETNNVTKSISIIFFFALLAVDFVSTAKSALFVSAEDMPVVNFDGTDISDDLQDIFRGI